MLARICCSNVGGILLRVRGRRNHTSAGLCAHVMQTGGECEFVCVHLAGSNVGGSDSHGVEGKVDGRDIRKMSTHRAKGGQECHEDDVIMEAGLASKETSHYSSKPCAPSACQMEELRTHTPQLGISKAYACLCSA
jgi:hypothetical protein